VDSAVRAAELQFERTLIQVRGETVGSIAALSHPGGQGDAANYGEVFLRDNVPVMLYLLLKGRYGIVRHFLEVCLELQSSAYQSRGAFPTSFVERRGELLADYGQRSIGSITSVDASLW
jgi:beta-fructofuranosidase